ncbi:hypothetical protein Pfo_012465 [Paulownia fortunei]|nr:hypothetical protein Pfo_012465 [Paulownia fortunei]
MGNLFSISFRSTQSRTKHTLKALNSRFSFLSVKFLEVISNISVHCESPDLPDTPKPQLGFIPLFLSLPKEVVVWKVDVSYLKYKGKTLLQQCFSFHKHLRFSLIARVRHQLSYGSFRKHICSPVIASCSVKSIGVTRHCAQSARSEDEEEEVEIDQRRLPADYDPANFDPTEHRSPPTERVWRLVDEISGLTLVEAAELSSIMMRRLGMKEKPVVGVMKPGAAGVAMKTGATAKEEKKPEKTAFELKMESYDAASKLKVIKEIRSFTDFGLKEAKDLVEKMPAILKKGVSKEEAEKIIEKMKAVGANVVMD